MSAFESTLPFILAREGGYANNPNDPGGATMQGITQRVYDAYRHRRQLPHRPVKQIAADEVAAIYQQNYWIDGHCDDIAVTHPKVALVHMDCCVNCGIDQAAKLLQRAIGGVVVDGDIGPQTLAALRAESEPVLVERYLDLRAAFYRSLVERRPASHEFLGGWLARLRYVARETGAPITLAFAKPESSSPGTPPAPIVA